MKLKPINFTRAPLGLGSVTCPACSVSEHIEVPPANCPRPVLAEQRAKLFGYCSSGRRARK